MSITLDNLAQELVNWCKYKTPINANFNWHDEQDVIDDFANYLSENSQIKALKGFPVVESTKHKHLVLYRNQENAHEGIIAEFILDANKKPDELDLEVVNTAKKFEKNNLDENYKSATRCIVGVYNDLRNRSKFHDIEFIEVFHDFEVGCAIKRLR